MMPEPLPDPAIASAPPRDPSQHLVHFYDDEALLCDAVASFLTIGLATGEPCVVITTDERWARVRRLLAAASVDAARAIADGRLVHADARAALADILDGDLPTAERFHARIEPLLDPVLARGRDVRARLYGDMVDLLWRDGRRQAALRLEELWNALAVTRRFTLLCAYAMGAFYRQGDEGFGKVCATHGLVVDGDGRTAVTRAASDPHLELAHRRELESALRESLAERQRLYEEAEAARRENELLRHLTERVSAAVTLEQTYDAALDGLRATMGCDRASILLFDDDDRMHFKAHRGLSDEYRRAVDGHSPWSRDTRDPAPVLVADAAHDPAMAPYRDVFAREGIAALAFVPLCHGGVLLGKFMLYYDAPHAFGDKEVALALTIARSVAIAVERRRTALALERERVLLSSVLAQLPVAVWLAEAPSGRVLLTNDQARAIFGEPPAATSLADYAQFLAWHPDGRPMASEELPVPRALRGETVRDFELSFQRTDGKRAVARGHAAPVRDADGQLFAAVAAYSDITDVKAADDARDRERELFLGMLGHDLRNPLSPIYAASEFLLKTGDLTERAARSIQRIFRSAERMSRMIDQILDFTRSGVGGGIRIQRVPFDFFDLCRQIVEEHQIANEDRALELVVSGDGSGRWDPDRMGQVLSNLVGNALDHGARDRPVRVTARGDGGCILLAVHNDGPPIPPSLVGAIFDPFRRARKEGTGPSRSLGLGLFISQRIVAAHGGEIAVASSEAEGTTFTVTLPRDAG